MDPPAELLQLRELINPPFSTEAQLSWPKSVYTKAVNMDPVAPRPEQAAGRVGTGRLPRGPLAPELAASKTAESGPSDTGRCSHGPKGKRRMAVQPCRLQGPLSHLQ